MERSIFLILLVFLVFVAIAFAQNTDWLYQGVSGKTTWVGGPLSSFFVALLFLFAILGGLHYLRNRTKGK